ncbi:MAG TPA: bifunctional UDP-N-acetylglucosamine diphosphorylase/glucosamine-1-phosphate N-acetyltransferase GlmU [Thermoanaerobaculia bacterium]|nr:bifunctional UDP-N-acetylglucosamine diphosphorylase/glucosamine-1-phosphate N-acetyltransferase GlmU [Thermoanaerobaculia bacterium]
MQSRLDVVILAAGLGTRMKSGLVKVLHRAAGRPLVDYVIDLAQSVTPEPPILIVGHQRDRVQQHCGDRARYCIQDPQLGTGHAVLQAESLVREKGVEGAHVLVLSGDVPLTRPETLKELIDEHRRAGNAVTMLTMELDDPAHYGRIIRDERGAVQQIVEAKDATEEQRRVGEVNGGIYVFDAAFLFDSLHRISSDNAQGEYYLTDLIAMANRKGRSAGAIRAENPIELMGVNSRGELALVHRELVRRTVERLMAEGVTFLDPALVSIDAEVTIGADTVVYPFVTIEGASRIGSGCTIEPQTHLVSVAIGDHVHVRTGTVAEETTIGEEASVGPWAHLRPGTVLGARVKIGNFVETKKAVFGEGSKASHLSYIGDAEVGADVNIGAGTITCNYDGVRKHKTIIEDGAFIGSDSQLVAPVTIGRGSYVGAGSTITRDVPPDSLALSRTPQKVHQDWAKRRREEGETGKD